jgi:type I restriction enzyme, S subunit
MINLLSEHIDIWTSAKTPKANGNKSIGNGSPNMRFYGIKRLRELILELAVHGKLVSQDPNDEPAKLLLKNIANEKERLIKEGRIKKQELLPEVVEDEKPFDEPDGWEWVRLGDIGETNIGLTYSPKDISDVGIPVLRSNNVQNGKIDLTNLIRVNIKSKKNSVMLQEGDLLICARNGSRNLVGKTAKVTDLSEEMAFGAFMAIFRSPINDYLLCFINSPLFRKTIDEVNTTTINQITQNNLKRALLPLPPLAEQQRIVAKVDELMALCDQLEQHQVNSDIIHQTLVETLLATITDATDKECLIKSWQRIDENFDILFTTEHSIDQLKKLILQLAVMGKLVPQDPNDEPASVLLQKIDEEKELFIKEGNIKKEKIFTNIKEGEKPFELPEGWEWIRIGEIGHDWGQKTPTSDFTYIDVSGIDNIYGLVKTTTRLSAAEAPSRARKIVKVGTVIYSTVRPYLKNICVINEDYYPEPIASTAFAILHPFQQMPGKFIALYLRSPIFVKYVESVQTGIAYPAINDKQFFNGIIPIPPLAEQHRIINKVDELLVLCDSLNARLTEAQITKIQLADAIIDQALV